MFMYNVRLGTTNSLKSIKSIKNPFICLFATALFEYGARMCGCVCMYVCVCVCVCMYVYVSASACPSTCTVKKLIKILYESKAIKYAKQAQK